MSVRCSIPTIEWERPAEFGLVSVVTIVRNDQDGLARTLDSVAAQTFREVEHVVVDGASTDGGLELLRERASRQLHSISEPDDGISDAFNKGLARTRGEWIQFLNAGDTYVDESSLEAMARHLGAFEILTGFARMDAKTIPARLLKSDDPLRRRALISHQATLTNRRVFAEHGGFDASLRSRMDYEFWLRVLPHCTMRFVDDVFAEFCSGGNSSDMTWFHREERLANRRHLEHPMIANTLATLRPFWLKVVEGG